MSIKLKKKKNVKDKELKERFSKIIELYYQKLERYALSVCKSREEAEDVVSETILIAFERFESLKDEKAFLSFLFTIASRVRITLYRKNFRYQLTEPDKFDYIKCDSQSPEDFTDVKLLYEALDKLNDKAKEAIILYDIIGLKYKEICKVQNASLPSVKLRIHRARKKLAIILGAEDDISNRKSFQNSERLQ